MLKFVVKRILTMIPIIFFVILIVFTIMNLTPSTPGRTILGITASQEQVDELNHELGYDRPFLERFFSYCGGLLKGDFGTSYRTRNSFSDELMGRLPVTLKLGFSAFVLSSVIGIILGMLSAVKQYSFADVFSSVTAILFASIPGFFMGMMLIYFFSLKLGWFPTMGIGDFRHYVLPVFSLTLPGIVVVQRLTRTTMLEALKQDYIRTAMAKGCSRTRITWKHALKNGLLPVLTVMGISAGTIIGGTVPCETVFTLPGMGTYILTAIQSKDIPVVMSCTVVLSVFFCLIMILIDVLYAVIDPRIRAKILK